MLHHAHSTLNTHNIYTCHLIILVFHKLLGSITGTLACLWAASHCASSVAWVEISVTRRRNTLSRKITDHQAEHKLFTVIMTKVEHGNVIKDRVKHKLLFYNFTHW